MFEKLIEKIAKGLDRRRVSYMIIGGQAVLVYGTPRLTKDIDITLGINTDQIPLVINLCRELGLRVPRDAKTFAAKTMVLPAVDAKSKIRVEFIFSFSDYEKTALGRASKVKVKDYIARFASVEDLIVHKIFAGRAVDMEDIKNILIKNGAKTIDTRYIRKWLKTLQDAPGRPDMVLSFNKVIAEAGR